VVPSYAQVGLAAAVSCSCCGWCRACAWAASTAAPSLRRGARPDEKRGYYTGWLQTSPTLGIVVSLAVIIGTRSVLGTEAFNAWGWRIPFLFRWCWSRSRCTSACGLQETPVFQAIKARGLTADQSVARAFMSQNLKYVLIASVIVIGEGCVWYSSQFWALYFLQTVKKVDVLTRA
jgi:hypothetical protein